MQQRVNTSNFTLPQRAGERSIGHIVPGGLGARAMGESNGSAWSVPSTVMVNPTNVGQPTSYMSTDNNRNDTRWVWSLADFAKNIVNRVVETYDAQLMRAGDSVLSLYTSTSGTVNHMKKTVFPTVAAHVPRFTLGPIVGMKEESLRMKTYSYACGVLASFDELRDPEMLHDVELRIQEAVMSFMRRLLLLVYDTLRLEYSTPPLVAYAPLSPSVTDPVSIMLTRLRFANSLLGCTNRDPRGAMPMLLSLATRVSDHFGGRVHPTTILCSPRMLQVAYQDDRYLDEARLGKDMADVVRGQKDLSAVTYAPDGTKPKFIALSTIVCGAGELPSSPLRHEVTTGAVTCVPADEIVRHASPTTHTARFTVTVHDYSSDSTVEFPVSSIQKRAGILATARPPAGAQDAERRMNPALAENVIEEGCALRAAFLKDAAARYNSTRPPAAHVRPYAMTLENYCAIEQDWRALLRRYGTVNLALYRGILRDPAAVRALFAGGDDVGPHQQQRDMRVAEALAGRYVRVGNTPLAVLDAAGANVVAVHELLTVPLAALLYDTVFDAFEAANVPFPVSVFMCRPRIRCDTSDVVMIDPNGPTPFGYRMMECEDVGIAKTETGVHTMRFLYKGGAMVADPERMVRVRGAELHGIAANGDVASFHEWTAGGALVGRDRRALAQGTASVFVIPVLSAERALLHSHCCTSLVMPSSVEANKRMANVMATVTAAFPALNNIANNLQDVDTSRPFSAVAPDMTPFAIQEASEHSGPASGAVCVTGNLFTDGMYAGAMGDFFNYRAHKSEPLRRRQRVTV